MTVTPDRDFLAHIVLYDDDELEVQVIKESMEKYLRSRDISVVIDVITKEGEVVAKLKQNPDIFITDVSLEGSDDILGLNLIADKALENPHICFAAMTSNMDQLKKLDQVSHEPEFLLPKTMLLPTIDEVFGVKFEQNILDNIHQNRRVEIEIDQAVHGCLKKALNLSRYDESLVLSLIRQTLSFDSSVLTGSVSTAIDQNNGQQSLPAFDKVRVEPLKKAEPGSNSVVLKATPSPSDRFSRMALALKFGRLDKTLEELNNYVKYVRWTLPFSWRVELMGAGVVRDKGILAYSMAPDSVPLNHTLSNGNVDEVEMFLERIFDEDKKVWYASLRDGQDSLIDTLIKRYFGTRQEFAKSKQKSLDQIFETEVFDHWSRSRNRRGGAEKALEKNIDKIISEKIPFKTCICHGDLHGGNVLIVPNTDIILFIDFEDTGFHHVYTDFVFIENAIRKDGRFNWPDSQGHLEEERASIRSWLKGAEAESPDNDGLKLLRTVRRKAHINFRDTEPIRNYFVHSLLFTIMMFSSEKVNDESLERMAAHLIACAEVVSDE